MCPVISNCTVYHVYVYVRPRLASFFPFVFCSVDIRWSGWKWEGGGGGNARPQDRSCMILICVFLFGRKERKRDRNVYISERK